MSQLATVAEEIMHLLGSVVLFVLTDVALLETLHSRGTVSCT